MEMKNVNWKELFIDILVDIVAGMIIAVGIYNFALNADFPVAGFSGIAIILYHIFGLPVGAGTIILNVPVAIFCYKFLGKEFFLKSMKSMIISSLLMDYVAPLFPVYNGSRLLAALWNRIRYDLYERFFNRRTGLHQRSDQESKTTHYTWNHYICS